MCFYYYAQNVSLKAHSKILKPELRSWQRVFHSTTFYKNEVVLLKICVGKSKPLILLILQ